MAEPPSDFFSGLASACADFIRVLGRRMLVHFCSLTAAGVIGATLDGAAGVSGLVMCAYVGLICLVPRGMGANAGWLIPSCSGLLLILIWSLAGPPWQFCLIWGGALTFCIRALERKGAMGWEWSALPWLCLALYIFFSRLLPVSPAAPPYLSFLPLALAGWGLLRLSARLRAKNEAPEKQGGSGPEARSDPLLSGRIAELRALVRSLARKSDGLPEEMRLKVGGIAESAESILERMAADPRDAAPGGRFLSRYLKAAHSVADDYARLAAQGGERAGAAEALERGRAIMARLEKAFAEERDGLLRNDTADFTAELNVLDKLLKMDGR